MKKSWFVVQTKSKHEDCSLVHLRNRGIEVYLPKVEDMTFHARRRSIIQRPLFPCYLFVRVSEGSSLDKVRWTQGVIKILFDSVRPVNLGDEVIEKIRDVEDCDGVIRYRPPQNYKRVRISRGPFKDITGIVNCWLSDGERVRILLDLVSYQASIDLHTSLIESIE